MTDRYLIEKCLVEHCSATLASMKSEFFWIIRLVT